MSSGCAVPIAYTHAVEPHSDLIMAAALGGTASVQDQDFLFSRPPSGAASVAPQPLSLAA